MMKRLFVVLICVQPFLTNGQTNPESQKIGHADWEYIFSKMPEYKQVENDLRVFEAHLDAQFKQKTQELELKYKAFQELPAETPDPIKRDKASEINYLRETIQKFQQDAQVSMQKKQNDLMTPIFAKVGKAIEAVAVENGFAYIINPQMVGGDDILLYSNPKYNISDLVLRKLGVRVSE
jgi:outer membrane protein